MELISREASSIGSWNEQETGQGRRSVCVMRDGLRGLVLALWMDGRYW